MPKPDYQSRITALQAKLKHANLDALFVNNPTNIRYLSGFAGTYALMIVDQSKATFITDGRYAETAESIVRDAEVRIRPLLKADDFFRAIFTTEHYARLGFEGTLTFDEYDSLKNWTRRAKTKLEKTSGLTQALRRVKDESEIASITKAARIADRMMEAAWAAIKPGITEIEISRHIRRAAEDLGGEKESFVNIVASGPNSSRPHHHASKRKIKSGDMVTVDLGAVFEGYCSDLTRNPVVGKLDPKFEKMYEACLAAQEAGVKACRAGITGKQLDAIARDIIEHHGYGEYFVHGLGHGVGLDIHEAPRLSKTSEDVLVAGNVVTIEPGIYVPGYGGVRIEDLIVVTDGKPRVLSRSPKELTVLHK